MAFCPSCVSGAPNTPYFPNIEGGLMSDAGIVRNPVESAARLSLFNDADGASAYVTHYVTKNTGGGLTLNHYQCFLYSADVGGNGIGEIFDVYGGNNNWAIMSLNLGRPLDGGRVGTITGTGAPQNVVANSCNPQSVVQFAYVGGAAAAAAAPVAVISNGVGFAVTLPAGAIYSYVVYG